MLCCPQSSLKIMFIELMQFFIDVVLYIVIWKVNWLHCLNYAAITSISGTSH